MKYILMLTMMIVMLLTITSCNFSIYPDDDIDEWDKVESWIMNTDGTSKTLVPCGYEAYLSPDNQKLRVYTSYDGIYEYDLFGNKTKLADTPNLWFYSVAPNQELILVDKLGDSNYYLTNGLCQDLKTITLLPERRYSIFKFNYNSIWFSGSSFQPNTKNYKLHFFNVETDMEYTISDTVNMFQYCFDNDHIVYYEKYQQNDIKIIKYDLLSNTKESIIESNEYSLYPFGVNSDKSLLIYFSNKKLYSFNLVTNVIKKIYDMESTIKPFFKNRYFHPSENKLFFIDTNLKMLDVNTGECTVLATGNIEFASLSPDGSKIYYITKTHMEGNKYEK